MLMLGVKNKTCRNKVGASFFLPTMQDLQGKKTIASLESLKKLGNNLFMQNILYQLVVVTLRVVLKCSFCGEKVAEKLANLYLSDNLLNVPFLPFLCTSD